MSRNSKNNPMPSPLTIRPLLSTDIPTVTGWARREGFAPGVGDLAIYRQTDRQGLWVGWLGNEPVGCIACVRYDACFGFIGMFLMVPAQRGKGYGLQLWRHAIQHLAELPCIGIEAAPDRIDDYAGWGFAPASPTTRWQRLNAGDNPTPSPAAPETPWRLLKDRAIPAAAVQRFDAQREPSPRPHFLRQWLQHPAGTVLALVDPQGACRGFGSVRHCLLADGEGWRLGPLVAETPAAAHALLEGLLQRHPGTVLIDAPGYNPAAAPLLEQLGFVPVSSTLRMYRGLPPAVSLADIYGLACLELG